MSTSPVAERVIPHMQCFLTYHHLRVVIGDAFFDWISTNGGMSQGIYLGPNMFLSMIDDLKLLLGAPCQLVPRSSRRVRSTYTIEARRRSYSPPSSSLYTKCDNKNFLSRSTLINQPIHMKRVPKGPGRQEKFINSKWGFHCW